jgi:hypothetical protein
VYFAAEDTDINPEDVEYTDILLACTRHLLEELRNVDPNPVLSWLRDRWQALTAVLQTDISLNDVKAEVQIQQIAKITRSIRAEPSQRYQIRQLLDPHIETLLIAINQFIADALPKLPQGKTKLVVIADGLDKIVPIARQGGRTNHEDIFLDHYEQLKALDYHVVYTVPISLALSSRASDLADMYNCAPLALPMIMVQTRDNQIHSPGLETLKAIVRSRMQSVPKVKNMILETEVFDSFDTLTELCLITGGHVRNLFFLMQMTINYNEDTLPLQANALEMAIRQLRNTYRNTVEDDQWAILATVFCTKRITNTDAYRSLLFSRCVLEYVVSYSEIKKDVAMAGAIANKLVEIINIKNDIETYYLFSLIAPMRLQHTQIASNFENLPPVDTTSVGIINEKLRRIGVLLRDLERGNIPQITNPNEVVRTSESAKNLQEIAEAYGGVENSLSELLNRKILREFDPIL